MASTGTTTAVKMRVFFSAVSATGSESKVVRCSSPTNDQIVPPLTSSTSGQAHPEELEGRVERQHDKHDNQGGQREGLKMSVEEAVS